MKIKLNNNSSSFSGIHWKLETNALQDISFSSISNFQNPYYSVHLNYAIRSLFAKCQGFRPCGLGYTNDNLISKFYFIL